jgi:ribosomal protein S18 acetylase RimI-like enzyme
MILINIILYFLLFGVCNCFTFTESIKNIFSVDRLSTISIETYNSVNTRGISSFITNERYSGLPTNLYNEMVGMMERDFSYRRRNCFSNLPFTILLAVEDNNVVGVITVECCDIDISGKKENHPVISNLIVSKKMRRKGIAKSLTTRAEKIAKSFDYKEIYLFVNVENIPAIRLYKSRGYKSIDDKKEATKIVFEKNRFNNVKCVNIMMKKKI